MSEKQINELLEEINVDENGIGFIDCGTGTDYTDNNRYQRIVAAIKQNIELQQRNEELTSELETLKNREEELLTRIEVLKRDIRIGAEDIECFMNDFCILLDGIKDIKYPLRIADYVFELSDNKVVYLYDPLKEVEPIKVEILISENSGKYNVCPICNNELGKYTAISRTDNKTEICSNCGTLEALEAFNNANKDKANEQS